jgi:hypothetical protein
VTHAYPARFASQVAATIRTLPEAARKELQSAFEQAQDAPKAFPQADRYDLDTTVRVITTSTAIVHYAILPDHLWVFALMAL